MTRPVMDPKNSLKMDCSKLEAPKSLRFAEKMGVVPKDNPPRIAEIYPMSLVLSIIYNPCFNLRRLYNFISECMMRYFFMLEIFSTYNETRVCHLWNTEQ